MNEEKQQAQEEELTDLPAEENGQPAAGGQGACAEKCEKHAKCEKREKREKELEAARAEAADYKDKWMRAAAEFDNFRKRNEQTRRNAYLDGKADVLLKILPVGDNLERALASCTDENTKKGIELVLRSFQKLLEDEGIEAIMSEPAEEGVEPGFVREVFLKGYKRGEKVLRYAQVKVTT